MIDLFPFIFRTLLSRQVRNCCFDTEHHDWLISDKVDIVPRLVLPLAGARL